MYISIEDIQKYKEEIKDHFAPLHREVINAFVYDLSQRTTEALVPVRYGKWIPVSTKPGVHAVIKCSLCGASIKYSEFYHGNHNYCHKCGAKMSGEENVN